ncbi:hypothetical protein VO63_25365 [Streptomyces showdoensis]|uniref:Uncharacterized protein n=1 Tax=Streptomyces showdoensis TaxID=68268 RepID=A0A2P2GJM3_STREW|nr:hypothetical protein VO63_25365 [Streptomyces showdoensis]
MEDGDGTGDRTGWPAVIRGRRERDRFMEIAGPRVQYAGERDQQDARWKESNAEGRTEGPNAIRIARA